MVIYRINLRGVGGLVAFVALDLNGGAIAYEVAAADQEGVPA
jgi:hypothetical protein